MFVLFPQAPSVLSCIVFKMFCSPRRICILC
ncbi:Protein of unknown function [Pyronema omphalodes CBS 100304]|uniref:Uncharacterized protein n=1 Tax=Pyronema omphalodes (strain CBS 100304) TaxID=1076935 RepID=U4LPW2_PYROM|nr:Protein of unknown function [Pyronema omphalodes CBS 100304]